MTEPLTLITEPSADGLIYVASVSLSNDAVLALEHDTAVAYAWAVMDAAERADYDAAVIRQLVSKNITIDHARALVADLRSDRPPIGQAVMAPMTITPGVDSRSEPFLSVFVDGTQVGQISVTDARAHATGVLGAVHAADLDAGYLRALRTHAGLDDATARAVVGDLVNWRPEAGEAT